MTAVIICTIITSILTMTILIQSAQIRGLKKELEIKSAKIAWEKKQSLWHEKRLFEGKEREKIASTIIQQQRDEISRLKKENNLKK